MSEIEQSDELNKLLEAVSFDRVIQREFLKKRKVFLWGAVHDQSSKKLTEELLFLEIEAPGEPITLYINSPGGVVTSGMIIYDTMKMISSPVKTVCIGLAASMGSIILSAGEKGQREIWQNGRVMIHQPSIGQLFGQASDIQIHADEINKTKEKSAKVLADNCGKSFEQVMKDFDRDNWMDAQASLEYGIVDKLADKTGF
jgi:ATP-dependent Clp protease protease subunit